MEHAEGRRGRRVREPRPPRSPPVTQGRQVPVLGAVHLPESPDSTRADDARAPSPPPYSPFPTHKSKKSSCDRHNRDHPTGPVWTPECEPRGPPTRSCTTRCTARLPGAWSSTRPRRGEVDARGACRARTGRAGRPWSSRRRRWTTSCSTAHNYKLPVGRLAATTNTSVAQRPAVRTESAKAADLAGLDVVVSTAAKWAPCTGRRRGGTRSWTRECVRTRCWQGARTGTVSSDLRGSSTRSAWSARTSGRGCRCDPSSAVRHPSRAQSRTASAPVLGLRRRTSGVRHVLPVHTVPQRYGPGGPAAHVRGALRRSGPDRVVDEAAASGWGLLELPARRTPRTDPEAVSAVALVVRRLLDRGGAAASHPRPDRRPRRRRHGPPRGTRRRQSERRSRAGRDGAGRGTGEPSPGPGSNIAPVLHPLSGRPRRHGAPSGDGPPLRPAHVPPPPRLHRGLPRGRPGKPRRAPLHGTGPAGRRSRSVPRTAEDGEPRPTSRSTSVP